MDQGMRALAAVSVAGSAVASARGVSSSSVTAMKFLSAECLVGVPDEYDTVKRPADMYLYTRPVEALPDATSEAYHHWALVFGFVDGSWRTLEGVRSEDLKLIPNFTKERPGDGKYEPIAKVEVSPFELREMAEMAEKNEANGKPYLLAMHNCQNWVLNLTKRFDQTVQDKIKEFKTLFQKNPCVACVGCVLSAALNTIVTAVPASLKSKEDKKQE